MKNRKVWMGLGLAVALASSMGWWWHRRGQTAGASGRIVTVERGDVEWAVLTTGDVRPRNRLEIRPPIPGRVETILVREGDRVRAGQILAWMSSTERAALLDAASAQGPTERARWQDLYKPAPLVAPMDGLVIARNVEPGQTAGAADALFVLSDTLVLKAQVDETDMAQVRLGQRVGIQLDAFPKDPFGGRVEHMAFEAKTVNNVTVYEVDVRPDHPPLVLRSGMTANLTFHVETQSGVLWLPASAIPTAGERAEVAVWTQGDKKEIRSIELGLSNGKRVEVRSGLSEGETIWVDDAPSPAASTAKTNPLSPMMRRPGRRAR